MLTAQRPRTYTNPTRPIKLLGPPHAYPQPAPIGQAPVDYAARCLHVPRGVTFDLTWRRCTAAVYSAVSRCIGRPFCRSIAWPHQRRRSAHGCDGSPAKMVVTVRRRKWLRQKGAPWMPPPSEVARLGCVAGVSVAVAAFSGVSHLGGVSYFIGALVLDMIPRVNKNCGSCKGDGLFGRRQSRLLAASC